MLTSFAFFRGTFREALTIVTCPVGRSEPHSEMQTLLPIEHNHNRGVVSLNPLAIFAGKARDPMPEVIRTLRRHSSFRKRSEISTGANDRSPEGYSFDWRHHLLVSFPRPTIEMIWMIVLHHPGLLYTPVTSLSLAQCQTAKHPLEHAMKSSFPSGPYPSL